MKGTWLDCKNKNADCGRDKNGNEYKLNCPNDKKLTKVVKTGIPPKE